MPKPCSIILRLFVLIVLLGWLGIARPAEAQQTVTLSGRVTDAAGNAISGVTVYLHRLPDFVFIDGQDTDGNGAYHFSAAPGTYQLQVEPPGPFIPQRHELTLATHTTQNVVLEVGVTLSGRVTGPAGQAVPWAYLSVRNEAGQQISFGPTNATGHYSLGVPAGTYQIEVSSNDFLDKTVESVAITQDTLLNITLGGRGSAGR